MTTTKEIIETDVVAASIRVYSDHLSKYTEDNATRMAHEVTEFCAHLVPGSRILDAGCGPGRDLARFTAAGHYPVGVDLNPDFCAVASAFAYVRCADLRELPFDDDSFDAVWACASLVHLSPEDATRGLAEFKRVACPGAPVRVSVKQAGTTGWTETPHGCRWFHVWDSDQFVAAVETAGLVVDAVGRGPVFVDVRATA